MRDVLSDLIPASFALALLVADAFRKVTNAADLEVQLLKVFKDEGQNGVSLIKEACERYAELRMIGMQLEAPPTLAFAGAVAVAFRRESLVSMLLALLLYAGFSYYASRYRFEMWSIREEMPHWPLRLTPRTWSVVSRAIVIIAFGVLAATA